MRIIETEAYYGKGKAGILSHSYHKNKSKSERFDSGIIPGTVYMYFAHGGDSINFSCGNQGSAVLIKSGFPASNDPTMLQKMRHLNPGSGQAERSLDHLCKGQTLFCKSLGLKVKEWDGKEMNPLKLRILNNSPVEEIIQTTRLGISKGHSCNELLEYRYIDAEFVKKCTKNPLTVRKNPPNITKLRNNQSKISSQSHNIMS